MANTNKQTLEFILEAQDQFSKTFEQLNKHLEEIGDKLDNTADDMNSNAEEMQKSLLGVVTAGSLLATAITKGAEMAIGGLRGIVNEAKEAVKVAGQFEQWDVAFETMLGSAEQAEAMMARIQDFAATTPFTLPEVVEGSKQLMAMGSSANEVIPELKALGDISAGLSIPLDRLVYNFGQVRAQTTLTGTELRDFSRAGVPLIAQLAEQFGVTEKAVKDMVSESEIGFEDVKQAFIDMTSEGGKFEDLMLRQADTMNGVFSNIEDNLTILRKDIAEQSGLFDFIKNVALAFKDFLDENRQALINLSAMIGQGLGDSLKDLSENFAWVKGVGDSTILPFINVTIEALQQLINMVKVASNTIEIAFSLIATGVASAIDIVHGGIKGLQGDITGGLEEFEQVEKRMKSWALAGQKDAEQLFGAINNLASDTNNFDIKEFWEDLKKRGTKAVGDLKDGVVSDFKEMSEESGKEMEKMMDKIDDLNKSYERQVESREKAFKERLQSMVIAHREKKNQLESDIKEETRAFKNELEERQRAYEQSVAEIKGDTEGRKQAVLDQFDEETRQVKLNLMRQLSEAHDSDATLIQLAKNTIEEKERERDKELSQIEADAQEELSRLEQKHDEQVSDLKQTHAEKLEELQTQLEEEKAIQEKHAKDFLKYQNAVAEDDISILKNKHKEQLKELKRYHEERLEEIKEQYEREQKAARGKDTKVSNKSIDNYDTSSTYDDSKIDYSTDFIGPKLPANFYNTGNGSGGGGGGSFAQGGIVPGVGTKQATVHGGEMILTPAQSKGLLQLLVSLDEGIKNGNLGGSGMNQNNNIVMQVSGDYDIDALTRRLAFRQKFGGN